MVDKRKNPVSEISKTISRNMERIVQENGHTIKSAAKLMGIRNISTFGHYLNEYVEIPVAIIFKFHQVFNVNLNELFGVMDARASSVADIYSIVEELEQVLQSTNQRLTPQGFAKILDIVYLAYKNNPNYSEVIKDILEKAHLLTPEIFTK